MRNRKIALICPPTNYIPDKDYERKDWEINGLLCLESFLREKGYEPKIIDYREEFSLNNEYLKRIEKDIKDFSFIGFHTAIDSYLSLEKTISYLKEKRKNLPIILGGPLVSSFKLSEDNLIMKNIPADIVVIGEGEHTLLEILQCVEQEKKLNNINGIIYREQNKLIVNRPRMLIKDLSSLPYEDHMQWPDLKETINEKRWISALFSRGCYYNCSFCFKLMKGVRRRSLEHIEEEFVNIEKNLGKKSIMITDENFISNREWAIEVSNILEKYTTNWNCWLRVNDVDSDLLKKFKRNKCETVWYGIESFDEEVIKRTGKRITPEQSLKAIEMTKEAGIVPFGFFIIGLPGETEKSLEYTIKMIEKSGVLPRANLLCVFPGTKLYYDALRKGLIKDELEYIKKFAEKNRPQGDEILINMTSVSNQKLVEARNKIRDDLRIINEKNF
ncbi:MAG: radical SAM protein [Candidatus Pacearchaeota archaeon]|nr:MAG: radical SAM protein [Candidatus Pacearchaeota archaeon]